MFVTYESSMFVGLQLEHGKEINVKLISSYTFFLVFGFSFYEAQQRSIDRAVTVGFFSEGEQRRPKQN